jgi:hypothetical protein
MAVKNDSSQVRQIKVLLSVLGAGLTAGILMALLMLYYYNPTGSYLATNVLLDPENAYTLRFVEPGAKAKSEGRYLFEGMYFSYFDKSARELKTIPVAKDKYAEFYKLIANDKSIVEPTEDIKNLFNQGHLASLILKIRSVGEDASKGIDKIFTSIDLVNAGDYYRIQLRQSTPSAEWIYFMHPKIYEAALKVFETAPGSTDDTKKVR